MPEESSPSQLGRLIHVSLIAGSYLVFDAADVVRLRREQHLPSALTGTLPQAPQQNAFLGLPLELSAEEVALLVGRGVVRVVDERKDAVERLRMGRPLLPGAARGEEPAEESEGVEKAAGAPDGDAASGASDVSPSAEFARPEGVAQSKGLEALPLYTFFHKAGYYMTPGLRFGCDFSVYPGDPFRFHSHFLATNVGWNEPISILDITASGRLATGVKKGFVYGGDMPGERSQEGGPRVRAITLEWAGM